MTSRFRRVGLWVGQVTRRHPQSDRFDISDLVSEAVADISARPVRLIATVVGTIFGVGALVATIGFSQTSAVQITQQFEALAGRQAVVAPATRPGADGKQQPETELNWDAATQVGRIRGVEHAALLSQLSLGDGVVSAVDVNDPTAPVLQQPRLFAGSPNIVETAGGRMIAGQMFNRTHETRAARVAVISERTAERLGIGDIGSQPSVFLGNTAYTVVGVYGSVKYEGDLQDAVIVPMSTARTDFGLKSPDEVLVRVAVNAGPILRQQAPIAVSPQASDLITVTAPTGVSDLQENVQSDVGLVFLILSIVVLLAGGFGIANVTMLSVMERTPEIGLRRAVGATQRQIATQFIAESVIIGLLGGILGSALGVIAIEIFAASQQWIAVTSTTVALGGVAAGALVGLVAGGLPARRAAKIEPVAALRGD